MSSKREDFISRNIIEVRVKKRFFGFLDIKGAFVDSIVGTEEFEQIKFSNDMTRIDIANKDLSKIYFFSVENFGVQIDGLNNFSTFGKEITRFYDFLNNHSELKYKDVFRLGVRCQILFNRKDVDFDSILKKYRKNFFTSYEEILQKSNSSIKDILVVTDGVDESGNKFKIQTAPITKSQALLQVFPTNPKVFEEQFIEENAMYFDIDYFQEGEVNEELSISSLRILEKIESKFNHFKDYFFD